MNTPKKSSGYPAASYGNVPNSGNPRYTEAWALIEAARRMAAAAEKQPIEDKAVKDAIRETLRLNWRLWTIFQTELSLEDDGTVPDEIRQNMLSLCNFVDKHTVETITSPLAENVMILVEINRNIASGLLDSIRNTPNPVTVPEAQGEHASTEQAPRDATEPAPAPKTETPTPAAPLSFDEDI